MTRGGREDDADGPERRCIVTGEVGPKAALVRFVLSPEGEVVPDLLGRLPGRGMWVTADAAILGRAVAKNHFARAARAQVRLPEGLVGLVEALLARRVVELVALARKSGVAVSGFEKVRDWLVQGRAAVLLQAADGSPRERARLRPPAGEGAHVTSLTAREIGLAFGRERVIHAALGAGGVTLRVVEEAARLARFRYSGHGERVGGDAAGKDRQV
ncbi:MAG: RNA-binding protein [Rhodobacteraceae bacterium]|jgi:predicted RNA-binding protein YlxR (DUF448 family)|nr:RNA-binding protein [Paracoccaceae bacterium]